MQRYLSLISTTTQLIGMQRARELFQQTARVLWITQDNLIVNQASLCLPSGKARTVLGREFHLVIFDAWSGLDVNALAAVTGTICAGGTLVLLTPPLEKWPEYPDPDCRRFLPHPYTPEQVKGHFIRRFVAFLSKEMKGGEEKSDGKSLIISPENIKSEPAAFQVKTTRDQQQALTAILQAEQPLVLSADRGRGKSAVLGMVAGQFHDNGQQVILTAPSRAAVASVLAHADYPVTFFAPDDLLQNLPQAEVLLVDEAAAIPLPMLCEMLRCYPRCIFATTLQGYEGSGRGFVLRFQRELDRLYPKWREVKLTMPVRWREGDRLEAFINRWLIMDGGCGVVLQDSKKFACRIAPQGGEEGLLQGEYQCQSSAQLAQNEPKLREVFNLLINAHYQTRPSDLRQMLDAPHITVHTIEWRQQVVAVALLAEEGGFDAELAKAIHAGQRRPHGHLLAQSLTFHAGISHAAGLCCQRIMRIAVAPKLQRQGVGTLLLRHLQYYAEQQQADYLGVSYALSPGVLDFWQVAGFQAVRLGYRKDKASGSRSLMQMKGLSADGIELANTASQWFQQGLPDLLDKPGDVPEALANALTKSAKT